MKGFRHIQKITLWVLLFQLSSCNKTNWAENYKEKEKSPFGTYIIHQEIEELFGNQEVFFLKENIYDYLLHHSEEEPIVRNYICIKNNASKLTEAGIKKLLLFANDGNFVFLALNYFSKDLKENLGFTLNNLGKNVHSISKLRSLKGTFHLENKTFESQPYLFDRNIRRNYFLGYNKNKTIVLGTTLVDGEKVPNFIKIYHGKGAIYLHANPVVFTNYYLLSKKENYAANVLSYLPNEPVLWDSQIKSSKYKDKKEDNTSVFKFFLEHKTLKWFLLVSFFGILLFLIFNARRKQRAIPVLEPLKNSTVAFTQTIANLYLKEEDHKNLVDKKIGFFLEKVRTKYLINTSNLNADFMEKLALKSGNEIQKTKYLIHTIITLNKRTECSEEELVVLHKMIDKFFKK